ncbi:MAG: polysaccharide deacetylase family protein [Opitutae bacterium]|nr:polysaccharide deacetylase family protein [Opitutae bacterium]
MVTPYLLPSLLSWWQPRILFRGDASRKVIYLTIDDAPTTATGEILTVLARHKVKATFFVISGRIKSDAALRQIVEAGHHLGNHLRTTVACSKLGWENFTADFDSTAAALKRVEAAKFFRPPSDFGSAGQLDYARSKGCIPVLGTVFPLDHWINDPWLLSMLVKWLAIPGGILIMHDGETRGARTAAVLDKIIPALKDAGYEFGDLNDLTNLQPPN